METPLDNPDHAIQLQPRNGTQDERSRMQMCIVKESHPQTRHLVLGGIDEGVSINSQPIAEVNDVATNLIGYSSGLASSILIFVRMMIGPLTFWSLIAIIKTALFSGIVAVFLSLSLPDLKSRATSKATSLTPSVVVNILWLLSLAISLSSALNATMFQVFQGTSRFSQPQSRNTSLSWGFMKKFTVAHAVSLSAMPALIVISFVSFFSGLVVYVWNIHATVGYCILVFMLVFTYGYQIVTIVVGACLGIHRDESL